MTMKDISTNHSSKRAPQTVAPQQRLPHPILIASTEELEHHCAAMQGAPLLAVDTESNSLFRYFPKVCLIQISVYADSAQPDAEKVQDFLVDPFAVDTLQPLGALLADPAIQIVMHAADNDILTMQRDFDFAFDNLFDTQLAARILGWPSIGLAKIYQAHFGIRSNKRMQRTNWGARPLTKEQIAYAQMDTHFLPALREIQLAELTALDRLEEAHEAFAQLAEIRFADRPVNVRSFWQMKATRTLPRARLPILEALWTWREQEAQRRDRPPFRILMDQALVALASGEVKRLEDLRNVPTLGEQHYLRYGKRLLQLIEEAKTQPIPQMPHPTPRAESLMDDSVQSRYDKLRKWRVKRAARRGVDLDMIFTNSVLMEIARRTPGSVDELVAIPEIGPWKAQTYGAEVLKIVGR